MARIIDRYFQLHKTGQKPISRCQIEVAAGPTLKMCRRPKNIQSGPRTGSVSEGMTGDAISKIFCNSQKKKKSFVHHK
jgi:hypothetical protein